MNQRFSTLIAAFCLLLLTVIPMLAGCNSFQNTEYAIVSEGIVSADGFIYDKYENSTVKITGMENVPLLLTIPAEIDGMPVVEIADSAFEGNELLLYLKLPAGNIKLGKRVFSGCLSLVTADLSNSVTSIPLGAFEECRNLTVIEGISAVTEIGDQAFAGCPALTYIKLPESLTTIGAEAFRGCTSLSDIILPESLTFVGESVFWGCNSLSKVTFGGSAEIPKYAFLDCASLTEVIIGDSVESIDEEAFRGCRTLYSVKIGKNVFIIHAYAFHACDSLTEINFAGDADNISIAEGNESLGLSN
ncbi:MAG: leucine-rich repeat domain-containing protein [Clostridia bacterium]|nr:leucine-rich repeat domain-containing protein [Clostridia bacterium]